MENPMISRVKRQVFTRVPIDILPEEELGPVIQALAEDGQSHRIVLLTYKLYKKARRNEEFSRFVKEASLVVPVSSSLKWGMKFLHLPLPVLYHPFDFLVKMLGALEEKGKSVYVYGGRIGEVQEIAGVLKSSFPKLRLVGRHVGGCTKEQEDVVITAIQKAGPTALLTGPGVSGKERWIFRNNDRVKVPLSIWSAQAFHIMSGKARRPSREAVQNGTWALSGLAWQPWRWFRALSYVGYFFLVLWYRLRKL